MINQIVLGSFFGDEGKGATVQWLCKRAIARNEEVIVVRFSGGAQCGHRVIDGNTEHICSSFGSGVLLGVPTYLNENVYIDPVSIENEFKELQHKTETNPLLYINGNCRVVTPFDIVANRKDSKTIVHGSCGEGIYHTFRRYKNAPFHEMTLMYAITFPRVFINEVLAYYGECVDVPSESIDKFLASLEWLHKNVKIIPNEAILNNIILSKYDVVIWEGSQGMLLDMDCGFMPHCTPSRTGLNGIKEVCLYNAEVFLVMRSYLTRHGNGFIPIGEQIIRDSYNNIEEPTNRDDGYQGIFRIGVFNLMLLSRLKDRHHLDNYKYHYDVKYNLVINHLDCIKEKFYYTRTGETISCMYGTDFHKSLESLLRAEISFDDFYVSYKPSEIFKV